MIDRLVPFLLGAVFAVLLIIIGWTGHKECHDRPFAEKVELCK